MKRQTGIHIMSPYLLSPYLPLISPLSPHYICGTSPGDRVVKSVLTGAGIGAVTGGFGGFVAGEVFGGEVTFGLTGIPGAYIGAHIGAAVGAVNGLGQGAVLAGICYAGFQYDK